MSTEDIGASRSSLPANTTREPLINRSDTKDEKNQKLIPKNQISNEITQNLKSLKTNQYNKEAWKSLISNLLVINVEEALSVFQIVNETFPTSTFVLKTYLTALEKERHFVLMEEALQSSVSKCGTIEAYFQYCKFFENKLLKNKVGVDLLLACEEVEKIYLRVLEEVGFFYHADILWLSYKSFLDKYPKMEQESQTVNVEGKLRSLFHQVIQLPIKNVNSFWNEFIEFETSICLKSHSKEEAVQLVKEKTGGFVQSYKKANEVSLKRESVWKDIVMETIPLEVLEDDDYKQLDLLKSAIQFERSNPLDLPNDKLYSFITRLYNQAIALYRYCPDLWIEAVSFHAIDHWEEAERLLQQGLKVMASSVFFTMACCDFYETHGHVNEANALYESFIQSNDNPIGWIQYMYFTRRVKGVEEARAVFHRASLSVLSPSLFIAAAYLEWDINHQEDTAKAILQSGLQYFSTDVSYILDYADFLLEQNDPDNACLLLENGISTIGKDMCSGLWEKLLQIKHSYSMTATSIQQLSKIEHEYYDSIQKNRDLCGFIGSLYRYADFNIQSKSIEDQILLKRRERSHLDREEGTRKLLNVNKKKVKLAEDININNMKAPDWLQKFLEKIPDFEREKARSSLVDEITEILARVKIPTKRNFIKPTAE